MSLTRSYFGNALLINKKAARALQKCQRVHVGCSPKVAYIWRIGPVCVIESEEPVQLR